MNARKMSCTNNCPFAEIKMTFLNFGQKAGFATKFAKNHPKAPWFNLGFWVRSIQSLKILPTRYGRLLSNTAIYSGKINSRFQKNFSEW